jgi:hypothetical protein
MEPTAESDGESDDSEDSQSETDEASKLEFKTVNEVYASNSALIKTRLIIHLGRMKRRRNTGLENLQRGK